MVDYLSLPCATPKMVSDNLILLELCLTSGTTDRRIPEHDRKNFFNYIVLEMCMFIQSTISSIHEERKYRA